MECDGWGGVKGRGKSDSSGGGGGHPVPEHCIRGGLGPEPKERMPSRSRGDELHTPQKGSTHVKQVPGTEEQTGTYVGMRGVNMGPY